MIEAFSQRACLDCSHYGARYCLVQPKTHRRVSLQRDLIGQRQLGRKLLAVMRSKHKHIDWEEASECCWCRTLRGDVPDLFAQHSALNPSWLTPTRLSSRKISLKILTIS